MKKIIEKIKSIWINSPASTSWFEVEPLIKKKLESQKQEIIKVVEDERKYRNAQLAEYMAVKAIDDILNKIEKL